MQRTYQLNPLPATHAGAEIAALLAREGRRIGFAAGETIQKQGDRFDGFWLVESGAVTVCRYGADGELTIYGVLGPGDLFGELAHFSGVPRQVDAVAEGAAQLVRIDAALVDRLLAERPEVARWLLRSLANQLRATLDRIESDRHLPAPDRVARALYELSQDGRTTVSVTQQQLADYVGLSRVSVGQVLGRLERVGLIRRGYRALDIVDRAALAPAAI